MLHILHLCHPALAAEPEDAALRRTRKQVQMLDDLYKGAVVLITENYVNSEKDVSAGMAAKKLFDVAKKKGWHEVRLLDATGNPYNEENSPKNGFEKKAIAKLLEGDSYYDEVVQKDGKKYLQAATIIPVVMKKCTMCHENYKSVPDGKAIGALSYLIPIE